nr:MAG TPA: Leucine-rich repeat protein [Bacteriophage sp.]
MAEQHIEAVLNEIKKFNTHIKNIGDALISKNIQTQNKLYLFAEEIKKIKVNTFADETLVAISNVLNVGFTEEELRGALGNFLQQNLEYNMTATDVAINQYKDNKKIKPIHIYARATAINNLAFNGSNLKKITAPLVTKIAMNAFENCSELEELSLGSYNYKTGLNSSFSLKNCPKVKKLVLGNNSEISLFDYTSKLSYSSKSIEIYTNDGKKYNKTTNRFE